MILWHCSYLRGSIFIKAARSAKIYEASITYTIEFRIKHVCFTARVLLTDNEHVSELKLYIAQVPMTQLMSHLGFNMKFILTLEWVFTRLLWFKSPLKGLKNASSSDLMSMEILRHIPFSIFPWRSLIALWVK